MPPMAIAEHLVDEGPGFRVNHLPILPLARRGRRHDRQVPAKKAELIDSAPALDWHRPGCPRTVQVRNEDGIVMAIKEQLGRVARGTG